MVVRDGAAGPEVFLQRRVGAMAFAAGMTVFPGGGVDPSDGTADIEWVGPDPAWWADKFGTTEARAKALVAGAVRETFEECGVLLADLLRPWANWITPVIEPRRYDTRFFVAVLPEGQLADGATSEADEVQWRTPAEALDRWRAGAEVLLPPTWAQLVALSEFASTADILAAEMVIDPIMPVLTAVDGRRVLNFPDNHRYFADFPDQRRPEGSVRE
jgi:8-oxo-dGTP pyrophosphatase MutT (NUDIX family)